MKRTLSALTSIGEEVTLDTFEKKTNPSSPLSCNSKASCRVIFSQPETQIILRDLQAGESRDPPQQTDQTIAATVSGDTRDTDTCTETGIDTDADAYSAPGSPSLETDLFGLGIETNLTLSAAGLGGGPSASPAGCVIDDNNDPDNDDDGAIREAIREHALAKLEELTLASPRDLLPDDDDDDGDDDNDSTANTNDLTLAGRKSATNNSKRASAIPAAVRDLGWYEADDFVAEAYRDVDAGIGCSPCAAWCGGAQDDVAVVGLVVGKVASDANALCLCRGSFDEDAISLLSGSGASFADDATISTYGSVESVDEDDLLSLTPRPTTAATTPVSEDDPLSLTPRPTTAATTPASAGEEVTLENFIGGNDGADGKVLEGQDDNEVTEKDLPTITSDLTLTARPNTNEPKDIASDDDSNKDEPDDNSADWHGVQRGMSCESFVTSTSSHSEIPDFLCNTTCDAVNDSSNIALTSAAKTKLVMFLGRDGNTREKDESTRTNLGEPKKVEQKKEETETILVSCGDMLRNPFPANVPPIKRKKPETAPQATMFSGDNAKENNDGDVAPVGTERTSTCTTLASAWEEMTLGNTNASADILNILLERCDGRPVPSTVPFEKKGRDLEEVQKVVTKKNSNDNAAATAEAPVGTQRTSATLASAWEEMTRGNTNVSTDILNILLERGDGRPVPSNVPLKRKSQDRKKAQKVVTNQQKSALGESTRRKDAAKTRVVMVLNRKVIAREKDMSVLTALGVPTKFEQEEEGTIPATTPTKARKTKSLMKKAKVLSRMKLKSAASF